MMPNTCNYLQNCSHVRLAMTGLHVAEWFLWKLSQYEGQWEWTGKPKNAMRKFFCFSVIGEKCYRKSVVSQVKIASQERSLQ